MSGFDLFRGDALNAYRDWPAPATIVSDGAYGVRGFHGDTIGPEALPRWYRPHIAAWAAAAGPATTLWFWNTELGWASVHPVLAEFGWEYVQLIVWDKGLAHIAGNVNGRTIRQFPVVTEVCAFYQRSFTVTGPDGPMPPKQWVRHEWARSGLSLQRANEACGVKNAATRKYHQGLAVVLAARGDDRTARRVRQRARPADRLAVLLAGRRAPGHRGRVGRPAVHLAARARGNQRLVAPAAAR